MIKAVVFDLDDTLISEEEYIISGFEHIASFLSYKLFIKQKDLFDNLIKLYTKSSKNVFNRLYEIYELEYTDEDIITLINEYRNHKPTIRFYDDVLLNIKKLNDKNIKLGIITDGFKESQRNKISALNADNYF